MIKKTLVYTDYDGNERTEDYHFNLTRTELMDMEMSLYGGLKKSIENIIKTKDNVKIYNLFKDIVRKSYGVKSPDGRKFMKSPEIFADFEQTEAFSDFMYGLLNNPEEITEFIKGIIPADVRPKE